MRATTVALAAPSYGVGHITEATESASEPTLIERVARGDLDALGALYDAYGDVAFNLALAITRERATAERAVEDAFLDVRRDAHGFRANRSSVGAWITSLVRRRALDACRARVTRPAPRFELVTRGRALASLAPEEQRLLEQVYFEGADVAAIARGAGISEGAVRKRLGAALRTLHVALARHVPPTRDCTVRLG